MTYRGYYEYACENGHGNACFSLGVLYRTSLSLISLSHLSTPFRRHLSKTVKGMGSLERSRAKAARFWEKACDVKHDRACHMISEMYHYGVGVEKNQSLAERIRKTSCDRGHADCCHALGVAYLTSTGKDRDSSKALEPLSRACERGHGGACHNLAVMYRKGDGVKKSDTLFEKFARLAETLNSQTVRRS